MTDDADDNTSDELPAETANNGIEARYYTERGERVLEFSDDDRTAVIAQNVDGYAMLSVRPGVDAEELERYYGFEMALDHAAELLAVTPGELPIPDPARDMGM